MKFDRRGELEWFAFFYDPLEKTVFRLYDEASAYASLCVTPYVYPDGLVTLFDYSVKDGGTRLPRRWRPSVLWGGALLGVLVVALNIADMVNVGSASFLAITSFRVRQVLSDVAALTLALAALWLAWSQLRPPPSVVRTPL